MELRDNNVAKITDPVVLAPIEVLKRDSFDIRRTKFKRFLK